MSMNQAQECDAAYKQAVLLKCYEALAAVGFTRFRKEGVDWPIADGFHCWVGLNTALEKEYVGINPFVGVHVIRIEKLWTGLKVGKYPGKYSRGIATYALHMGELTPDEPVFRFSRNTDVEAEAVRLARLYADTGLAYARSIASYELLLPLLRSRIEVRGGYPERVAACLCLMDRKEEARTFVEDYVRENYDYFTGFAGPFLEMLNRERH